MERTLNTHTHKGNIMYFRVIDYAGRWLTAEGFTSYVHYDALRFDSFHEATNLANFYNAEVERVRIPL